MKKICLTVLFLLATAQQAGALMDAEKAQAILQDLSAIQQAGGDRLGYAEAMQQYLARGKSNEETFWREREQISPFDLFSGALAIRESLQTSTIRAGAIEKATVDIATLKGPQVKSHPFGEMLKGRKTEAFPLAGSVPPDWFYAHFSSLTRALDFGDYLNKTGGALYNRFSDAPVDTALKTRMLSQLAIEEHKEARIFYDSVIEEMALVSSDFFFAMGTDVSLLFRLKAENLFKTTIQSYRQRFVQHTPGAREFLMTIEGKPISAIFSPDMRLRSYLYFEGKTAIISNSPVAMARLLRIMQKKEAALASSDEFKYMRSVYLADRETEDGFIYFSDAFIRRLVSPQLRIAEARRMNTAFQLAQLEKLILLHRHAYGRTPKDLEELISGTALDEKAAKEMRAIFDSLRVNGFRAEHPEFGTLGFLKPNLELTITKVSQTEAEGYRAFVERYSNFWREYFDPIGIRFKKKDSGIKIEICILPLIENSIYNQIKMMLGGAPSTHKISSMHGETLSLAARMNLESIRGFGLISQDKGKAAMNLTGNIQIHGFDNFPTIDFEPGLIMRELTRGRTRPDVFFGLLAWSLFHPLRLAIETKTAADAENLIDLAQGMLAQESRRHRDYTSYEYTYQGKKVTVFVLSFFRTLTFRFHAWVDGNTIQVTSTREYAEKFIDAKKDTQVQRGNLVGLYRPAQIRREKAAIVQSNAEKVQYACLAHLGTVKLAALVFPNEDAAEAMQKRYGFKPVCPAGGKYSIKGGNPTHSIFGTHGASRTDMKAIEDLFAEFFSTEEFKLNFEFTPHGIMTAIETK